MANSHPQSHKTPTPTSRYGSLHRQDQLRLHHQLHAKRQQASSRHHPTTNRNTSGWVSLCSPSPRRRRRAPRPCSRHWPAAARQATCDEMQGCRHISLWFATRVHIHNMILHTGAHWHDVVRSAGFSQFFLYSNKDALYRQLIRVASSSSFTSHPGRWRPSSQRRSPSQRDVSRHQAPTPGRGRSRHRS